MKTISEVILTPFTLTLNGIELKSNHEGLGALYREYIADYPKFFKMDGLCKLGFIASELLLKGMSTADKENMAVILFGRAGCLANDRSYQETIANKDHYFPSPAVFVYTLANIVTGEIAIRHKIYGETSCYILKADDEETMNRLITATWTTSNPSAILTGWIDYENDSEYQAKLKLITK